MAFAPFPSILSPTSVFGGPDENPISEGGKWTGPVRNPASTNTLRIVSNQLRMNSGAGAGTGEAYRTSPSEVYTDTDVWATVATLPANDGDFIEVMARIQSPASVNADFYTAEYVFHTAAGTPDTLDLYRVINTAFTLLVSTPISKLAAGDGIGLRVTGVGATVTVTGYLRSVGVWNPVTIDFADTNASRIVAAGPPGVELNRNNSLTAITAFGAVATRQDGPAATLKPIGGKGASW